MKTPGWQRAVRTAESVIGDVKKLRGVIEQAVSKMEAHSDALKGILDDLQLIFRLARAWLKGDYTDVSKKSLAVLVGALVYFLMPLDTIPDFIPGLGFMDDVTVVGLALTAVKSEVEKFRGWESRGQA
ncbi:MAG: YkvA family protein [Candidatus Binatia bacterium]